MTKRLPEQFRLRLADFSESERIGRFYAEAGRSVSIAANDLVIIAECKREFVGVCRVVEEGGHAVLRGMLVAIDFRRRGIAAALLEDAVTHIGERVCFCLSFAHLVPFYSAVGFRAITRTAGWVMRAPRSISSQGQ